MRPTKTPGKRTKLAAIRRKNARLAKRTPYNYCDRWCEQCTDTARCTVYQEEFDAKLTHLANGRDPYDMDVVLEDVRKNLEKSLEILKKAAAEKDIDLSAAGDDRNIRPRGVRQQMSEHPLQALAMEYAREAAGFLEDASTADGGKDLETIRWYHTLIPVKVSRMLSDLTEAVLTEEYGLSDAVAQLDILKKALNGSEGALRSLLSLPIDRRGTPAKLLKILHSLRKELNTLEAKIERDAPAPIIRNKRNKNKQ